MSNADILTDFLESIKARAKAQKADPYAYSLGFLQTFVHMNMTNDPALLDKMVQQTKGNYEAAGRTV